MTTKTYKRNIFQRLMGKPMTQPPTNNACWQHDDGVVTINLSKAPELTEAWGAVCLEEGGLPHPILVMRDGAGGYHAFCNKCAHGGRKLDPVAGTETICCCSMGKSIYDYEGKVLSGSAQGPVQTYAVREVNNHLIVTL